MSKSLVVLSGGQDSTTCLYWAKQNFDEVLGITFDYGQRHKVELEAARTIGKLAGLKHHRFVDLRGYGELSPSSLTHHEQLVSAKRDDGLPSTFTPGRNLVFLTVAASYALAVGAKDVVTGVCQTDFSGYPDCRDDTMRALEAAINLGVEPGRPVGLAIRIHTPLMWMTKAESVRLARRLPGCWEALTHTVTCYVGDVPGCGECPSCLLRVRGFEVAGEQDPAL